MARNLAPGYCVVERPGTLDYQARELFRDVRSPATKLFMKLNADTQYLKPGQILIVADPDTPDQLTMQMLTTLRQAKNKTNAALVGVSGDNASFMQKHYGMIAALTGAGDKIFGTFGDAGEKYFTAIEQTLKEIEASYQNQFRTQGTLIGQQFFVERNQLLNQLKNLVNKPMLGALARNTVKFREYENMKRALNLSSRSIVHEWSTVGMGGWGYVRSLESLQSVWGELPVLLSVRWPLAMQPVRQVILWSISFLIISSNKNEICRYGYCYYPSALFDCVCFIICTKSQKLLSLTG